MRILLLTDNMDVGGAETHILTLAKGLISRGNRVFCASGSGRSARKLKELGVRHVNIDLASRSPLNAAKAYIKLFALCKRANIDVIHAHSRMAALVGSAVAKNARLPLVTTAHARFSLTPARKLFSRWGYVCAAVSEDIKQYLGDSYGVPPENIRVIENGVDTSAFSPLPSKERKTDSSMHVVFMSRMDTDCAKAAQLLCSLAPRLCESFPELNFKITLAGGGNAFPLVRALASAALRECGADIQVIGGVENVPSLLQSADVFVGVSRAALEAMSCGVPCVIAGDEGFFGIVRKENFKEAANENFCARGCGAMSKDKLFEALATLCAMDKSSLFSLGRELREEVRKTHDASLMTEKTLSLYKDALQKIPQKNGDVVFCGYYGCGNTGDDALLRGAVLRAKKSFPQYSLSALTGNGKRDETLFGLRCVRRKSLAALSEISRAKILIFGGGTLLQDATSKRSLLFYIFLLRYAQRKGVRCELWGNGIGPLRVRLLRRLVARALCGCAHIGVRDVRAGLCVRALTKKACVLPVVEDDLALDTPQSSDKRIDLLLKSAFGNKIRPFAAVAVKGSRIKKSDRSEFARLRYALSSLKALGYDLLFLEFFPREDHRITSLLAKRFGGKILKNISASDLVGIISRANITLASRFHALVFSYRSNIPCVAFGTDPKIKYFINIEK